MAESAPEGEEELLVRCAQSLPCTFSRCLSLRSFCNQCAVFILHLLSLFVSSGPVVVSVQCACCILSILSHQVLLSLVYSLHAVSCLFCLIRSCCCLCTVCMLHLLYSVSSGPVVVSVQSACCIFSILSRQVLLPLVYSLHAASSLFCLVRSCCR